MQEEECGFLEVAPERKPERKLAFRRVAGIPGRGKPGAIFLGGLASAMTGSKGSALALHARERGYDFLRFDYSGHGESSGHFASGSIGQWLEDALFILDCLTEGPQILIGSSLGGWLMLHLALQRKARIKGLIGIAAAPDFTEDLIWNPLSDAERRAFAAGREIAIGGDPPIRLSWDFIESARPYCLLAGPIALHQPLRLFQGLQDREVPAETARRLARAYEGEERRLTFIEDGDHRLSRPQDLALIIAAWEEIRE